MRKLVICWMVLLSFAAVAQDGRRTATVPVVMLSDIHFDPFADPAKVSRLQAAPVEQWDEILRSADTPGKDKAFSSLLKTCHAKGIDTEYPLLMSSLQAQQAAMPRPLFVTVSGDLMAHSFDCKFRTLVPSASKRDYAAFAARTVAFVVSELRHTYPHVPLYLSLGNNDSGCADYREDAGSDFLKADAHTFAEASEGAANARSILGTFAALGDYSVVLPHPILRTRLIVLQDIFAARNYAACGGDASTANAGRQLAWLRTELGAARARHERVWVMGHVPPGIHALTASASAAAVCATNAEPAEGYLQDDALLDLLIEFADVIKLAVFGHTHMDEIRVLEGPHGAAPMKIVPALTTVNGNMSAFTVARIQPATATMQDFSVYTATSTSGEGPWVREYDYGTVFGQKDFSGASTAVLVRGFAADRKAAGPLSSAYIQFFESGTAAQSGSTMKLADRAASLKEHWQEYACAIGNGHADAYKACVCAAR